MRNGDSLNWEYKNKSKVPASVNATTVTTAELEALELERMKFNAFKVAKEVAERIDCAPVTNGYMTSFVSGTQELFFWDRKYLTSFFDEKPGLTVAGHLN